MGRRSQADKGALWHLLVAGQILIPLKITLFYPQMGDAMMVLGGHDDHDVVPMNSGEVLFPGKNQVPKHHASSLSLRWTEMLTTGKPHPHWGGPCWYHGDTVLVAGGMDAFFTVHRSYSSLSYPAMEWTEGPALPWAMAGAPWSELGGTPTFYGGFGMGFQRAVVSLKDGQWVETGDMLAHSRVSGLSLTVPEDLWAEC